MNGPALTGDRSADQVVIGVADFAEIILDHQMGEASDHVRFLTAHMIFGAYFFGLPWRGRVWRGKAPVAGGTHVLNVQRTRM